MQKDSKRALILFLAACYGVAFIAGIMTRPEITGWYAYLAKPEWRPPNWLFGPVWTVLYGMMAVAGWKVWCAPKSKLRTATLWIFGLQLILNFLWSPVFFSWHRIGTGFVVIASLAGLLTAFVLLTWKIQRVSAWLFVPYLVWVTFAAALNYSIWTLNPRVANQGEQSSSANSERYVRKEVITGVTRRTS